MIPAEVMLVYNIVRETSQFAPLVVVVIMLVVWKNDLKHFAADVKWIKAELVKHLRWHAERE